MQQIYNIYNKYHKIILTIFGFVILLGTFSFGQHFQGTVHSFYLSGKLAVKKIYCAGDNNLLETYTYGCVYPQPNIEFKMNTKLHCKPLYWSGTYTSNFLNLKDAYMTIDSTKIDHLAFDISIDTKNKLLYRSNMGGEIVKGSFMIIHSDESQLIALRKTLLPEPFLSTNYETITLVKATGKGTMTYHASKDAMGNPPTLNTFFFECK